MLTFACFLLDFSRIFHNFFREDKWNVYRAQVETKIFSIFKWISPLLSDFISELSTIIWFHFILENFLFNKTVFILISVQLQLFVLIPHQFEILPLLSCHCFRMKIMLAGAFLTSCLKKVWQVIKKTDSI